MDDIKKIKYKNMLIGKKIDTEQIIKRMNEYSIETSDELSNYDNHPAEMGSNLYEKEHNETLKNTQKHKEKDIDNALENMEKGDYGICKDCGSVIPDERLEILPETNLCISCANEKNETIKTLNNNSTLRRPSEERMYDAPLGRKYLNRQEDDEFEGNDQLNDLQNYGSSDSPQDMGGYKEYKEFYTNKIDKQGTTEETDNISNKHYISQL